MRLRFQTRPSSMRRAWTEAEEARWHWRSKKVERLLEWDGSGMEEEGSGGKEKSVCEYATSSNSSVPGGEVEEGGGLLREEAALVRGVETAGGRAE